MKSLKINNKRRNLLAGSLGLGAVSTALPSAWTRPIINSVILPAHAVNSVACPDLTVGNLVFGPLSGPIPCSATFDFLSTDPSCPLTVISITTSPLATDVVVTINNLGLATDTSGPRVVWQGPSTASALSCSDLATPSGAPLNDVTFTVTASCDGVVGEFTQDFTLLEILS